jgi:hypothetical protein
VTPSDQQRSKLERIATETSADDLGALATAYEAWQEINWDRFKEAAAAGRYSDALNYLDNHQIAEGIAVLNRKYNLSQDEAKAVLLEHWPRCNIHRDHRDELVRVFERAGYVSDTGRIFEGPVVAYRGNLGEDPRLGISWTLSKAKARWFALRSLQSGYGRPDRIEATASVWRATLDGRDLLGYFFRLHELEIVVNPSLVVCPTVVLRPRGHVQI